MTATIEIPTPKYGLGADVWLLFQGSSIPTTIKVRAYDPDKGAWFYRVALSGQWHIEDDFGPRTGEAA